MTAPHPNQLVVGKVALAPVDPGAEKSELDLDELLTVEDIAALLKVHRSWVYARTRRRVPPMNRLPFVKLGKYVRFELTAIRSFLARRRTSL